jgi:hypothetical protein
VYRNFGGSARKWDSLVALTQNFRGTDLNNNRQIPGGAGPPSGPVPAVVAIRDGQATSPMPLALEPPAPQGVARGISPDGQVVSDQ